MPGGAGPRDRARGHLRWLQDTAKASALGAGIAASSACGYGVVDMLPAPTVVAPEQLSSWLAPSATWDDRGARIDFWLSASQLQDPVTLDGVPSCEGGTVSDLDPSKRGIFLHVLPDEGAAVVRVKLPLAYRGSKQTVGFELPVLPPGQRTPGSGIGWTLLRGEAAR
ncbi:MAG: hypothetical protein U0166_29390 [Acidobacteriota bacterium]